MHPTFVLPLPRFVLRPYTAIIIAGVHLYLGIDHVGQLFGGAVEWTHFWKGFGAIGGAYVFAALASRGLARNQGQRFRLDSEGEGERPRLGRDPHEKPAEAGL